MVKLRVKQASKFDSHHYHVLAYRDYIAARTLLLKGEHMPAAMLASTALEKYIKCILAIHGVKLNLHMDSLPQLRTQLASKHITLLNELDPDFVEILASAYTLRYYDSIERPLVFSFHTWQFLAELDVSITLIESRMTLTAASGSQIESAFARDKAEGNPALLEENHVLLGKQKSEQMTRHGQMISVKVGPEIGELYSVTNDIAPMVYDGRMLKVIDITIT
jgi:HEPN domain-containing protein